MVSKRFTHDSWVCIGARSCPVVFEKSKSNWSSGSRLNDLFRKEMQQRGASIVKARKASSAMSTAQAVVDHIHDLHFGTRQGDLEINVDHGKFKLKLRYLSYPRVKSKMAFQLIGIAIGIHWSSFSSKQQCKWTEESLFRWVFGLITGHTPLRTPWSFPCLWFATGVASIMSTKDSPIGWQVVIDTYKSRLCSTNDQPSFLKQTCLRLVCCKVVPEPIFVARFIAWICSTLHQFRNVEHSGSILWEISIKCFHQMMFLPSCHLEVFRSARAQTRVFSSRFFPLEERSGPKIPNTAIED